MTTKQIISYASLVIVLWMMFSSFSKAHPLKMTFSKMTMAKDGTLTLTTKFFLDDITQQMQTKYRLKYADFSTPESNGTKALQTYMNTNLLVIQEETKSVFHVEAVQKAEDNLVLVVISTVHLKKKQPFIMINSLFFDVFPNQINSVRYKNSQTRFRLREESYSYE